LVFGCHTYEVRQYDSVKTDEPVRCERVAVIMNPSGWDRTKQANKLFTEQLIVSLQKQGIDVAERQKVEALLVDAALVESSMADLTRIALLADGVVIHSNFEDAGGVIMGYSIATLQNEGENAIRYQISSFLTEGEVFTANECDTLLVRS
jgi:hypothetical protein